MRSKQYLFDDIVSLINIIKKLGNGNNPPSFYIAIIIYSVVIIVLVSSYLSIITTIFNIIDEALSTSIINKEIDIRLNELNRIASMMIRNRHEVLNFQVDNITLNNITVNKGNCKMIQIGGSLFPKKLNYGESVGYLFPSNCNVLQIVADTDNGKWTIEY